MNSTQLLIECLRDSDFNKIHKNGDIDWSNFIELAEKNRLYTIFGHIYNCSHCKKRLPENLYKRIVFLLSVFEVKNLNYRKLLLYTIRMAKHKKITLIFVKEIDFDFKDKMNSWFKNDLDILCRENDFLKLSKIYGKFKYKKPRRTLANTGKPIPQFKIAPQNRKTWPEIEYRYKFLTLPAENYFPIISAHQIDNLTDYAWEKTHSDSGLNFLDREMNLLQLCLIYYCEDMAKSFHNLYRIYLFTRSFQKNINWNYFYQIAKQFKVTNIISLVFYLIEVNFKVNYLNPAHKFYIRLSGFLINPEYISRNYPIGNKSHLRNRIDSYTFFLTQGIISDSGVFRKAVFFMHPKRLLFLSYAITESLIYGFKLNSFK